MAGKVDGATHAAAIAKIGEAVRHEAELRSHVDEIVNGTAFKGSHRCQAFLTHIVEMALHGDPADLRERSIGVALFGRSAAYDTGDDAIVRVTASDVRKRLLQHYGNTGAHSGSTSPPVRTSPSFVSSPPPRSGHWIPPWSHTRWPAPTSFSNRLRPASGVHGFGVGACRLPPFSSCASRSAHGGP
jgi:hypothetical protein